MGTNFAKQYAMLAITAKKLAKAEIRYFVFADKRPSGDFLATKQAMERDLRRQITPEELSCLSLTRMYPLVPKLHSEAVGEVNARLFPDGNDLGDFVGWERLATTLEELAALKAVAM